ncbi:FG-GAP-like repeat-containing protein [Kribbella yunnanensis]|uniref:FG-GAP-like repeat-containing protein n=1 Tax=Kribbella yunnanensis TaxID=190194 RepID=UPI0031D6FE1F
MSTQSLRRRTTAGLVALLTALTLPALPADARIAAGPADPRSAVGTADARIAIGAGVAVVGGSEPGDLVGRDRDGRLWVHPGTGDATRPWDPAVRTLVGSGWSGPNILSLADVSLDGLPDLFTRDPANDGTVGYHPTPGWDPAVRVLGMAGWNSAQAVLAEDVDGDGRPDLLARQSGGNLRVWPHDGNTTASPWLTKPAYDVAEGLERTDLVAFGEVTGDGLRDLVIREDDGTVWVLPHPGAAAAKVAAGKQKQTPRWQWSKQRAKRLAVGVSTNQLAAGVSVDPAAPYSAGTGWAEDVRLDFQDVNGDGLADLLATDRDGRLRIALHTGAPAGENPWPATVSAGDWSAYDLVAIRPVTKVVSVVRIEPRTASAKAGTTTSFRATLVSPSGSRDVTSEVTWSTASSTVATIDSSGRATAHADGNTAVLAGFTGAAVGAAGLKVGAGGGSSPAPVRPGDAVGLDRDGRLWHYPYTGDPARPWSRITRQMAGIDWAGPDRLVLGDVTLDGTPDLFVRDPAGDGSVWFHPHSAADPQRPWSLTRKVFGMSGWNNAAAVILEDVNSDGRPDLLSRMPAGNLRFWLHDGKTASSPWLSAGQWSDIATGLENTTVVRFGEVTGDNRRDLVIRERDGSVWVLPNPGGVVGPGSAPLWRWNPATADPAPADPTKPYRLGTTWAASTALDLQDVNGDGRADLLATSPTGELLVHLHNGNPRNPWTATTTVPGNWNDGLTAFSSTE